MTAYYINPHSERWSIIINSLFTLYKAWLWERAQNLALKGTVPVFYKEIKNGTVQVEWRMDWHYAEPFIVLSIERIMALLVDKNKRNKSLCQLDFDNDIRCRGPDTSYWERRDGFSLRSWNEVLLQLTENAHRDVDSGETFDLWFDLWSDVGLIASRKIQFIKRNRWHIRGV